MQKIRTFLWFDGDVEEAMKLYTSIFKNSKVLSVSRAQGRVMFGAGRGPPGGLPRHQ